MLNYWETLAISGLTRAELLQVVRLHGHEHLDAARSNGRGAILVGAHLGSLALAAQVVPAHGYPVVGLLEPVQPPELFDLLARQRGAFGMRLLPIGPAALRELVTALRRNEIVALVVDRDVTGSGPILEFFGAPTHVADGAAALSVRTGAPILPGVGIRRADGTFDAVIEAALPKPTAGDPKRDVLELTRAVIQRLEYHIRSRPLEWTVFQKRWPALDKAPASGVE